MSYNWPLTSLRLGSTIYHWDKDERYEGSDAYMNRIFLDDEKFVKTDNATRIPLLDDVYELVAIESVPGYCVFDDL